MSTTDIEKREFQAEVSEILDIVIHSLYTDKEIFIRELISNASDALEKMRLKQLAEGDVFEADRPLEINISTDEEAKTLTISDHGIGMTRTELNENLGTIAHSGTKAFLQAMKESGGAGADVIGQFGVGFYSSFMVAESVEVYTHSWQPDGEHVKWASDGGGSYTVEEADGQHRGCRIVVHLKEDQAEFAKPDRVKDIIERYSNFVGFPVNLNGERVNAVEAVWLKSKSEVDEEEYKAFYQFVSHSMDAPRYTMHFSADAPLSINALLFVPGENMERFGMGPQPAGVALYCRKVLIDQNPEGLLPEWLRFVKGVIDSEDLPLNISRESMQDTALVRKLNTLLTKRFVKFLAKQGKDSPEDYLEFFKRFGRFLKEGIVASPEHSEALSGLLRFESTMSEGEALTSLDEYVDRMKEGQEEIYYLVGDTKAALEKGPFVEAFQARGLEVALFTEQVDDYVLQSLREFKGKKMVCADRADIDMDDVPTEGESLSEEDTKALVEWMSKTLTDKVEGVAAGKRLVSHPVVALIPQDAPNAQLRAMMEAMGQTAPEMKARLEINPRHDLVKQLHQLKAGNEELAEAVACQLADNALLAAGLGTSEADAAANMNSFLGKILGELDKK